MRTLVRGLAWGVGAAVFVAVGAVLVSQGGALDAVSRSAARWGTGLAVARVAAIAALWWWWTPVLARVSALTEEARTYLAERRNFYCLALCAIELFVVQNALGNAWNWLGSA